MPDSMYDRLGDMLSDALESGDFFSASKGDKESIHRFTQMNTDATADKGESSARSKQSEKANDVKKITRKPVSPTEQNAFAVLGLSDGATADDAKKAYHEKLKYYHPDKHGDNPVLQKVARDKTRQVIEAWRVLEAYFNL